MAFADFFVGYPAPAGYPVLRVVDFLSVVVAITGSSAFAGDGKKEQM
jgi:hypothetical protein